MTAPLPPDHRARQGRAPGSRLLLALVLALGLLLFVWRLGQTGLVDETPPLFAASARGMAESGDWVIPRVNGLPRYDKPPLVYWLMGLLYALPAQAEWNPLGTWAARLPSALACLVVMLALAGTLQRWPQPLMGRAASGATAEPAPRLVALSAALAFALSPLVLVWGRTAVSDALLTALLALSMLLIWQAYADPARPWWAGWIVLGLAVLTKGPVAVVLLALTLLLFGWSQADWQGLLRRLRPFRGLALTGVVALPWYLLALWKEGRPFWDSFFGYHNLQRFTSVVNDHLQPWWYFGPVLVVASLPVTPLLLVAIPRAFGPLPWPGRSRQPLPAAASLGRFAVCWLLSVLLFFTLAATKLPSYWLPATPAAAILIALAAQEPLDRSDAAGATARWAWRATLLLALTLALVFAAGPLWVPLIQDPEMPTLTAELLTSRRLWLAAAFYLAAAVTGALVAGRASALRLLGLQLMLVPFVPFVLVPLWTLGDQLRGSPVRVMATAIRQHTGPGEPLAMVGILKPSLHYYSGRVVIYEGKEPVGLVNLADRLRREDRPGQHPGPATPGSTVVVVIDRSTAMLPFWRDLQPEELARAGLYRLWRLQRHRLEQRADRLEANGLRPIWDLPVPERY